MKVCDFVKCFFWIHWDDCVGFFLFVCLFILLMWCNTVIDFVCWTMLREISLNNQSQQNSKFLPGASIACWVIPLTVCQTVYNSALVFTSCLCRASRSVRGENLGFLMQAYDLHMPMTFQILGNVSELFKISMDILFLSFSI